MENFTWLCGRKAGPALLVNALVQPALNVVIATQLAVATQIAQSVV